MIRNVSPMPNLYYQANQKSNAYQSVTSNEVHQDTQLNTLKDSDYYVSPIKIMSPEISNNRFLSPVSYQTQVYPMQMNEKKARVQSNYVQANNQQFQQIQQKQIQTTNITQQQQSKQSHIHAYKVPQMNQAIMQQQQTQSKQYLNETNKFMLPPQSSKLQMINEVQQKQSQLVVNLNSQILCQQTQSPQIQEFFHIQREMQVLSVEDVEEPWKKKCIELELRIYDLESDNARLRSTEMNKQDKKFDDSFIQTLQAKIRSLIEIENNLKNENKQLSDEIDIWRERYQKIQKDFEQSFHLQDDLRKLRSEISYKDQTIIKLEDLLKQKDYEKSELIGDLNVKDKYIKDLQQELEEYDMRLQNMSQTEQRILHLTQENESWKKKFLDANREYHTNQEKLMLALAELESIKSQKTIIQTEKYQTSSSQKINNVPQIKISQYKETRVNQRE